MSVITELHNLGQSIWYDNIERKLLQNGEMARMIENGEIRGVTSNPSIFNQAISNSTNYDDAIQPMAWADWKPEEIFFQLAVEDIQETTDLFHPLFLESNKSDGFVSLEVNPTLAYDAEGTFLQAEALWKKVNRKNLMVKIPATKQGLIAIRESIAAGININITLIFSVKRYSEVIDAYFSGLEDRVAGGLTIDSINSVASFFVSRVDSKIDTLIKKLMDLGKIEKSNAEKLMGKAGIANSRLAYQLFEEKFSSLRFKNLSSMGARVQRPLWASTSTKSPNYSDVMYVDELIGDQTVNTMPPKTLEAFKDHGTAVVRIRANLDQAKEHMVQLEKLGIIIDDVTQELEDEGVRSFASAFSDLLNTIQSRKEVIQKSLGDLKIPVRKRIVSLNDADIIARIYEKDASVWTDELDEYPEIRNRLDWLSSPFYGRSLISNLEKLREEVLDEGFTHVLLLGMGGSSLAAEVMSLTFRGVAEGCIVNILDSTDPRQIKEAENISPLEKTIFLVSSKSGSTSEVQAFLSYFYELTKGKYGDQAGKHFIAITDPGTALAQQAINLNFRAVLEADPGVGGRYSALTLFGLVPAVLMGIDLDTFLENAISFAKLCRPEIPTGRNPGLVLGAILGEAALNGKDKLTIIAEEPYRSLGSWMEQLIAESSGKSGKGIVPVDIEPFSNLDVYSEDRIFIYIKNDGIFQPIITRLTSQGHIVLTIPISSLNELSAEFFRWEIATSVACSILKVNAFNQPDVQDNKTLTKQIIAAFKNEGRFNEGDPDINLKNAKIYKGKRVDLGEVTSLREVTENFLDLVNPGDYIGINAYLPRNEEIIRQLQEFRKFVLEKTRCATTLGFGPRFLHSTGQLQKGGPNSGLFIQITDQSALDLEIPSQAIKFGDLLKAQALADYQVLISRDRRIIRVDLCGAKISDLWK
jgi:transaldolase/glucose-6-phosphate isomerase